MPRRRDPKRSFTKPSVAPDPLAIRDLNGYEIELVEKLGGELH
jgi:hypothetical protein